MDVTKTLAESIWRHFMHDSMRRNSSFLIAGQLVSAISTFLFWIIVARLYEANTLGLAAAFISYAGLVAAFTTLGLPTTIIRFLPSSKHKSELFGTSFLLISIAAVAGAVIAWIAISRVAPDLTLVTSSYILTALLVGAVIANSLSPLLDNTFMAFKKGEYILIKHLINSLPRLILPFVFVGFAMSGIISVYVLLAITSVLYGIIVVKYKLYIFNFQFSFLEVFSHKSFAVRNYLGGLAGILPSTLVPIIVLNNLGAAQAAYFYIPLQMAAFLSVISGSVSQSFISEASQTEDDEQHNIQLRNTVLHLLRLLLPASLLLILFGWIILRLYGPSYSSNGYLPLVILSVAGLFVGFNWIGDTWLVVKKKMNWYIIMNVANSIMVVGLVFASAAAGLVATSLAWLTAQALTVMLYIVIFMRHQVRDFEAPKTS